MTEEHSGEYQYLILEELRQLNKTLEILTEEHIKHFNEWRKKNE